MCLAAAAAAAPSISLRASLRPEIPGRSTTIRLGVRVVPHGELVPPPLSGGELLYPAGMDVQLSGLGIDACEAAELELFGLEACPANSLMGYGSAIAELPIKREVFSEAAQIAVVRTFEHTGHEELLLYVYGETGLSARIVLPAELLPAAGPYGGLLDIHAPLVPTFPQGPDVSVEELRLVLGPKDLTYYERIHHRTIRYKPAGIPLPRRCPRGGFHFAVNLSFLDGSRASATTVVACPHGADARRR